MGLIFSRFRKKKSSLELLEEIEDDINLIEEDRRSMMMRQKKYVGRLIIYSIIVYCIVAAVLYFSVFYGYKSLRDGLLYIIPLVIIPIILLLARKGLNYFFSTAMVKKKQKLMNLRAEKKRILDEVMEKETFKVAKGILEKFAPDQLGKNTIDSNGMEGSLKRADTLKASLNQHDLKKTEEKKMDTSTNVSTSPVTSLEEGKNPSLLQLRPLQPPSPPEWPIRRASTSQIPPNFVTPQAAVRRRLVRPLPPPQMASRGIMERLIESLIGDGPSRRYALICSHCSSHNGMALKEEFEYISFRCAYCGFPNPSRKDKPRKSLLSLANPHNDSNSGDADSTDHESKEADDSTVHEAATPLTTHETDEPKPKNMEVTADIS